MKTIRNRMFGLAATAAAAWLLSTTVTSAGGVSYTYDTLNRLTNVNYGNGSVINYTYDAAGNRLTYSGVVTNDAVAPSVVISSPTTGGTFSTTAPLGNLAGTASDNVGVTLVNWSNDRGGMGTAAGTTNWVVTGIALQPGTNVLSVTAYDAAGNGGVATLAVNYVAPPAIRIAGLTIASNAVVQMTVVGPVGGVLAIQTSTNLVQWYTIGTVANATGSLQFPFPFSAGESKRFFRVMQVQVPTGMVLIPAGSFTMGNCMDPSEGYASELPLHEVNVSAFYMDTNVVSYTLWTNVYQWATNHGYSFEYEAQGKAASHPACGVIWYDAVKWCNARSEKEGRAPCYYTDASQSQATIYRSGQYDLATNWVNWVVSGYRLPTEAEWEKAARGGVSGHRFPWGDTISWGLANYNASPGSGGYDVNATSGYNPAWTNGYPYTTAVGTFAPNGYGLYDMAGNVYQWCWDWYGGAYYSSSPGADPHGPAPSSSRVLRGGSWSYYAFNCRAAYRNYHYPTYGYDDFGFRSVLPPGQ
jgi:YD repeat-containing protein